MRFFRLYERPATAASRGFALALGGLFVSERSFSTPSSDEEDEDFVAASAENEDDGHEDISVLALDEEKLLHKLPPSPSLVLDVQTNAATAAVLCETRELFLYDLATFQLLQTIVTASPAMALGARWLAYQDTLRMYPDFKPTDAITRCRAKEIAIRLRRPPY